MDRELSQAKKSLSLELWSLVLIFILKRGCRISTKEAGKQRQQAERSRSDLTKTSLFILIKQFLKAGSFQLCLFYCNLSSCLLSFRNHQG
jgi:hypothetical protein